MYTCIYIFGNIGMVFVNDLHIKVSGYVTKLTSYTLFVKFKKKKRN